MNSKKFSVVHHLNLFPRSGTHCSGEAVQLQPAAGRPVPGAVRAGGAQQVHLLQEHGGQPAECVEGGRDTPAHGLEDTVSRCQLSVFNAPQL